MHNREFALVLWAAASLCAACSGDDATTGDAGAGDLAAAPPVDLAQPLTKPDLAVALDGGGTDGGAGPAFGCPALPAAAGPVVSVGPAQAAQLADIVRGAAQGTTISLADGVYPLPTSLHFTKPGVTLRGASGMADRVVLDAEYRVAEAVVISASDTLVADVTIRRAVDHPVHMYPIAPAPVTGARLYRLVIEDGGEQFVKVNSTDQTNWVDDSAVECSRFRMTAEGRPHVEPNPGGCYTGGIDVHGGRGWRVRQNRFEGIYCEGTGLAEHAIHFWIGSRDTLVENNVIVDCARGIGFGLGPGGGRTYVPDPYPGVSPIGHFGGIIRNNVIWATTRWFDTGIELQQAHGARVVHNTVVSNTPQGGSFFSSIDYRFANTDAEIRNNLTTRITLRDNARGALSNNVESTPLALFADPAALDFHLLPGAAQAIDQGAVVDVAGLDLDGEPHTKGAAPDVGADER